MTVELHTNFCKVCFEEQARLNDSTVSRDEKSFPSQASALFARLRKQNRLLKQHCRSNHYVSEEILEKLLTGDRVVVYGYDTSNIEYFPKERKIVLGRVPLRARRAAYATVECFEYEPHMFIVTVVPQEQGHWVRYCADVSDYTLIRDIRDMLDWPSIEVSERTTTEVAL